MVAYLGQVCCEVIEVVADAKGVDPLELPPLSRTLDTDALDALVAASDDDEPVVEFTYADCCVVVRGPYEIVVFGPHNDDPG